MREQYLKHTQPSGTSALQASNIFQQFSRKPLEIAFGHQTPFECSHRRHSIHFGITFFPKRGFGNVLRERKNKNKHWLRTSVGGKKQLKKYTAQWNKLSWRLFGGWKSCCVHWQIFNIKFDRFHWIFCHFRSSFFLPLKIKSIRLILKWKSPLETSLTISWSVHYQRQFLVFSRISSSWYRFC